MKRAQVVSFHCVLKDKIGNILSSTFNHDVMTQSDHGELLKGLADGLVGLKKGEKRRVSLSADQAYGYYDPKLVLELPRKELSGDGALALGDRVKVQGKNGEWGSFRIISSEGEIITLDGNHPLAGQDLEFFIETTAARYATSKELMEASSPGSRDTRLLH